jgi:hypothetical protein
MSRIFTASFAALTVAIFLAADIADSQWSTNPAVNNAISPASGSSYPTIVGDGSGGAIITWEDHRGSDYDIYAQRINSAGVVQWTANGVAICTASGSQIYPTIVGDGSGGAIISWEDDRSGNVTIYAQRINSSGVVQWTTNGVAACTATGGEVHPTIISDGSGGAIITWFDRRNGTDYDIYAQRINSSGVVQWTTNGAAVCTASGDQQYPTIVGDGTGGAIITWHDFRNGNDDDIYAQRMNPYGEIEWTTNGIAICTAAGGQFYPTIASDGSGGAIITWHDHRNGTDYDIYAQRINPSGVIQWTANGVALCTVSGDQLYPTIAANGSGGAIITWYDLRTGNDYDIYAQKVNSSGTVQWTTNGVAICTASGNQENPIIVNDGSGGAIITWDDHRNGIDYDIYAQRINSSGAIQWTANGAAICTAWSDQLYPTIVSDGSGGAIITWSDGNNAEFEINAQRVDALGNLYPEPWITLAGDVANDQGGRVRLLWNPSPLDVWGNSTVSSYTIKMGSKSSGLLGKTTGGPGDSLYWQTAGWVAADRSEGYTMIASTAADSGLEGVPYYYFQVIAKNSDSTVSWQSNIVSAYSVDNVPPVPVGGSNIENIPGGYIQLQWNRDKVDNDLLGYDIYRSTSNDFSIGSGTLLQLTKDTVFVDSSTVQGTTYYYRIAGEDVHGNVGTPSGQLNETALALELSAFSALQPDGNVVVQWTMTTEINDEGFVVERAMTFASGATSQNASQSPWSSIGYVQGAGNSNSPRSYSFTDQNPAAGTYLYRLKQLDQDGSFKYSQSIEVSVVVPKVLSLSQNYPNPFNPTTMMKFTIPEDGRATLKVYNAIGQEVVTLFDGNATAGEYHQAVFDASRLASGIYFSRLEFAGKTQIRKMLLVK